MNKKLANLILLTATFFGSWAVYANPDLAKGAKLFQMCAACHGQSGEGSQILNAPASAGQSQWYVKQQLNNFIFWSRVNSSITEKYFIIEA